MPSLFLSYRRLDSPDTVKLIHERLHQRLGRWEIFYDHQSIPQGQEFPALLQAKVTSATAVLVIIGPKWVEILRQRRNDPIDHIREEVRLALEAGNTVIPVTVGHARMPCDADLADFPELAPLLKRNGREVRPDPLFDPDIARIADGLEMLGPGEMIGAIVAGKYKVLQQIGEGGMGVVYVAEQKQPVKRTVALKLIKLGMDSKEILARFDAERQALAMMDHPHIAKVLDAGTAASGRPYFVMQYVKGVPITQYCDDKKLPTKDRLELFTQICKAVQHAHQKGIIHRDIKPSNVLVEEVDGKPMPKVIDFGLAKALDHKLTDKTLHTAFETRVGTLEYSSPEQAAGQTLNIDTRTDIYSLGALLYELLTGTPPFSRDQLQKLGEQEMCRLIREQEPPTPSKRLRNSDVLPALAAQRKTDPVKLLKLLRGEPDWIAMKALEKDPARRYATANALARDVERHLHDEPVEAVPPSASYRLRKLAHKYRRVLGVVAAFLLLLVVGTVFSAWQAVRANQAKKAAELATEEADQNFALARQAVREMLTEVAQEQLVYEPRMEQKRKALLAKAKKYYEKFLESEHRRDDRGLRTDTALAFRVFADMQRQLGEFNNAEKDYRQGIELFTALATEQPNEPEFRYQIADSKTYLGEVLRERFKFTEAKESYAESRNEMHQLVVDFPGTPKYGMALGRCYYNQGLLCRATKDWPNAEESFTAAIRLFQDLTTKFPGEPPYRQHLARAYLNYGPVLRRLNKPETAKEVYQKAIQLQEALIKQDSNIPDYPYELGVTCGNFGFLLNSINKLQEAEDLFCKARGLFEKLAGSYPSTPVYKKEWANSENNLGIVLAHKPDYAAAEVVWKHAQELFDELARDHPGVQEYEGKAAMAEGNLGWLHLQKKEPEMAVMLLKKSISRLEAITPKPDALASALADQQKYLAEAQEQIKAKQKGSFHY